MTRRSPLPASSIANPSRSRRAHRSRSSTTTQSNIRSHRRPRASSTSKWTAIWKSTASGKQTRALGAVLIPLVAPITLDEAHVKRSVTPASTGRADHRRLSHHVQRAADFTSRCALRVPRLDPEVALRYSLPARRETGCPTHSRGISIASARCLATYLTPEVTVDVARYVHLCHGRRSAPVPWLPHVQLSMIRVTYGVIPPVRTGEILTGTPVCWASSIWPPPR